MKKLIIFLLLIILLTGCGPELSIQIDEEQTRIIFDEEIDMLSLYVRVLNTGQLPANDLYARFIIDEPAVQEAIGGIEEFVFTDSNGEARLFQLKADSSYFIAEAFSLESNLKEADLLDSITVEILNSKDKLIVEHTFNQVAKE
jgi:hypothetical protein